MSILGLMSTFILIFLLYLIFVVYPYCKRREIITKEHIIYKRKESNENISMIHYFASLIIIGLGIGSIMILGGIIITPMFVLFIPALLLWYSTTFYFRCKCCGRVVRIKSFKKAWFGDEPNFCDECKSKFDNNELNNDLSYWYLLSDGIVG